MRAGKKTRPVPLGDLVARYLAERQGHPNREREAIALRVFAAFRKIGPPLTDHAEPIMLRGGFLTLLVNDSAWLTELTFLRDEILQRLNQGLKRPAVRGLRMRLGNVARAKPPPRVDPTLAPAQQSKVGAWAELIPNQEVREAMMRAAAWSLTRPPPSIPLVFDGPPGPHPRKDPTPPTEPARDTGPKDRWKPDRDRWKNRG